MWSEEEVNAAIEEYAAAHPAGVKVYAHRVKIAANGLQDESGSGDSPELCIISTRETVYTAYTELPANFWFLMSAIYDDSGSNVAVVMFKRTTKREGYSAEVRGFNTASGRMRNSFIPGTAGINVISDTVSEL